MAHGRIRELPDSADDRRPRHGIPDIEYAVLLVHVARIYLHMRQLLCGWWRVGCWLDCLSNAFKRGNRQRRLGLASRTPRRCRTCSVADIAHVRGRIVAHG